MQFKASPYIAGLTKFDMFGHPVRVNYQGK